MRTTPLLELKVTSLLPGFIDGVSRPEVDTSLYGVLMLLDPIEPYNPFVEKNAQWHLQSRLLNEF
ncbi:hypothetical protein QT972_09910 [Microcoleus sp. herbarium7]|uniref:hypothetical protein n=1 Tax=Microcoleus sp. herbarium7 TaxID=3055435 RepID=UPI002FD0326D